MREEETCRTARWKLQMQGGGRATRLKKGFKEEEDEREMRLVTRGIGVNIFLFFVFLIKPTINK